MPRNPGGIQRGDQGPPPPLQVLGAALDGGTVGRVLRRNPPRRERRHSGIPTVAYHIKCSGGRGGPPLVILGGGTGGVEGSEITIDKRRRRRGGKYVNETTADGGRRRGMQV